jgi:hypothetical protein
MSELNAAPEPKPVAVEPQAVVWSEENKARIAEWVEKWRGLLLMNGHHFNLKFHDDAHVDEFGDKDHCPATMSSNHPYMSGHLLEVFPAFLNEPDQGEAERRIVHELTHIITFPQRELTRRLFRDRFVTADEAKNANETATDWIANIIWALKDGK